MRNYLEFAGVQITAKYYDAGHNFQFQNLLYWLGDRDGDVEAEAATIIASIIPPPTWTVETTQLVFPELYALWDRFFLKECLSNGNFWFYNIGGSVVTASPRKSWSNGK